MSHHYTRQMGECLAVLVRRASYASAPQDVQSHRLERANNSRYGPGLQDSTSAYDSIGLLLCPPRPLGASKTVPTSLLFKDKKPRTPNNICSVCPLK